MEIRYGSKVLVRDNSSLDGEQGIVIKISGNQVADVLFGKDVVWPVRVEELELASKPSPSPLRFTLV